jgi:tetratricopeptide (TPR) repeat protein
MVLDGDLPADLVGAAAEQAATRGLALDPGLPDAHVAAGYVAMWARWDWEGAARSFEAALALDDDAVRAHHARALWLAAHGRTTEGREAIARARRLAPEAVDLSRDAARLAFVAGDVGAAIRELRVLLAAHPDDADGHQLMSEALASLGHNADAAAHYRQALVLVGVAERYADEDRRQFAARGLAGLTRWYLSRPSGKPADRYGVPFKMASSHAVVGDADAALRWLEQAVAQRDSRLLWLRVHPRFAALRADPRFAVILQRLGLGM